MHSPSRRFILVASIAAVAVASGAKASSISWDGGAADNLWVTPANWAGDLLPAATDDLDFGTAGPATIDLGGARTAKSLQFSLSGFTLGTAATANVLTNTSGAIAVDFGITGQINAILGGSSGLALTGGGSLTLAGANTFTGTVALTGDSTLTVSTDANLGAAANGLSLDGGTLNATAAITSARALTLGASTNILTFGAGASVWTGQIGGAGGFTKSGTGSLQLGGSVANTFTGQASVNNGILFLNKPTGNAIGGGGLMISSDSAVGYGPATVTLQASEQIDNTAPIIIDAKNSVTGGATNRAALDLAGKTETIGELTMNTTTAGSAVIVLGATGKLILNGDVFLNQNRNATLNTGREVLITGSGNLATPGVGGTVDLGGVARTISVNSNFSGANLVGADATIEAVITHGSLVKAGGQALRLGAVNTFSALTVNQGTVRALVNGAIPANIPLTVSAPFGGTTATLDFGGFDYTLTAANNLVFGGGAGASTIATGTGTLTLTKALTPDFTNDPQTLTVSGKLNLNGVQDTFDIPDSLGTTTELLISAAISGSNTGLTKKGAGTLALGGTNTFTGNVQVNSGALALRAVSAIPDSAVFNPAAVQLNGGTLQFDTALANDATFNSILGVNNGITVGPSGGTILVNFGPSNADRRFIGRVITVNGPLTFDISRAEPTANQLRLEQGTVGSVMIGSGAIIKNGDGRLSTASPGTVSAGFSGPWTINAGTVEGSGVSMGDSSATNTIKVNGLSGSDTQLGNLSLAGNLTQNVMLNGGAISTTGADRIASGNLAVVADSSVFLNNFWTDAGPNGGNDLFQAGILSGSGNLSVSVNRPGYDFNNSRFVLQNAANTYSGRITIENNLGVENNSLSGSGKTIGTAPVTLAGGKLILRDNGTGSNGALAYGTNITVSATTGGGDLVGTSTLDLDRSTGANTGNTFQFGTLAIGDQQLDVIGSDLYKATFSGLTTLTGNPTFNVTNTTLTLGGGVSGAGQTFTKIGNGTLRIVGTSNANYTLTAGTIESPTEPAAERSLVLPLGTGFSAGYVATQANLIDHVTLDSAGVVGLGVSSTFNPNFTGFTGGLRLGATADVTLTGTITPADNVYRLGGGGGTLVLPGNNVITGARNLDIGTSGTLAGVVALDGSNDFTGSITLSGGQLLRISSNGSLGNAANAITSNGGGIQFKNAAAGYDVFAGRTITFTGGFILDTNGADVSTTVAIGNSGAGGFTKTGAGKVTLSQASTYGGKTVISGGTLSIAADNMLGTAPTATTADQLQLQGGTLEANGTFSIPVARGVQISSGGGTFAVPGSNTLTLASNTTGAGQLTKEGTGTLLITADPNNTGGFLINGGVLALQHSGSTDGNFVINNSGTLRVVTTNDLGDGFNVTVNTGGIFDLRANDQISQLLGAGLVTNGGTATSTLTVNTATNFTFDGSMQSGAAALAFTKGGANTVTLTGANTYTGTTIVNNGTLVLSGPNAGITGSPTINVGDNNGGGETLIVGAASDVVTGTLNRLTDAGNIVLNGATTGGLTYNGPAVGSGGNVETVGTITASAGLNNVNLVPGTGNKIQITTGTFARTNNGTLVIRGANLGGTGAGSTRLVITNPAASIAGAGGADGSTTKSIIPFAIGDTSLTGPGTGFLTHDATNGVRLLTNAEYDSTIAGNSSLRNVSSTGGETVGSDVRINSLRLTGTAPTTIAAGARMSINSGALLFTNGSTLGGAGTLDFGSTDGIIQLARNTTGVTAAIDTARVTGNAGLTFGLSSDVTSSVFTLGGDNTVVGNLTVNQATVNLTSAKALNDQIPMTVLLRPGAVFGLNGNSVVIRDLQATSGAGTFQNGSATTAATLTSYLTASRSVQTVLQNGGAAALNLIVSGGVSTLTIDADASATGTFELRGGATQLSGANGTLNDFTSYVVHGGTLRLTNASGSSNTNRLRDASTLTMNAATLDFDNNATAAAFSETVGPVVLNSGGNTITVDKGASTTNTSILTLTSLARNAGATLNLTSQNNGTAIFDLGTAANSRLVLTTAPTLDDGILGGWATIDSSASTREFVKYVGTGTISATALAAADYTTALATGANPTQNVKITASPVALTGDTQVNSLNIAQASATTLDIGAANTLRVESGGVILAGAFSSNINNGKLTAGNGAAAGGDLIVHTVPVASSGLTWTNSTDAVTLANVVNGTPIVFSTAPGGLTAGVIYYAVNSSGTTFQVATAPGGPAVAITTDGTTGALTQAFTSTISSVIADNGVNSVNLVKAGGGVLTLAGANSYTGKTYVNGGLLRINSDNNLGTAPATAVADSLTLSNGSILDVSDTMTLNANRGISVGAGNNIIAIPSGTAGNGKTLTYNGAITSLGTSEGSLQFRSNTTAATTDGGKIDATLSGPVTLNGSLVVDAGTITLSGTTNTIGRSLNIGTDGIATLNYTGANNRLVVGKGITDTFNVGAGVGDNVANQGTLNLSGLGNLTVNVDLFQLGVATAGRTGKGVATLATNNDIVAGTAVNVGFSNAAGNNAVTSSLTFGSGVNNVMTKTFTVGGNKSIGIATVDTGGVVNLNGFGNNTLDLLVGVYGNTGTITGPSSTSRFDMTGGTLNANLNRLVVGEKNSGSSGGNFGAFTVAGNDNNIVANSVTVGNVTGSSAANTTATGGTLNFGGGTFMVNNDVSIGLWSNNTTGTPTSTGTLNITGGTMTVGGTVTTTNTTSATSTLNLDGGTLDMTAGTINVDTLSTQSGTLKNVAEIYSGDATTVAPLTKTGSGTLTLRGVNTYTGGTNLTEGTLLVRGSISGNLTTAANTTLGGSGAIGGALAVSDNSTLSFGLGGLTAGEDPGNYDQLNAGSINLGSNVRLSLSLGFAPNTSVNTVYYILNRADNGTPFTNKFFGLAEGATVDLGNGYLGKITYQANWTGNAATSSFSGGNDVAIAIPEPGALASLAGGFGMLLGMQRFRRRSK